MPDLQVRPHPYHVHIPITQQAPQHSAISGVPFQFGREENVLCAHRSLPWTLKLLNYAHSGRNWHNLRMVAPLYPLHFLLLHVLSRQTQQALFPSANFGVEYKHILALDVRSPVLLLILVTQKRRHFVISGRIWRLTWKQLALWTPPISQTYQLYSALTRTTQQVQILSVISGARLNLTLTHVAKSVLPST